MKTFTVYANCQGRPLAKTLLENEEFSSIYKYVPLDFVQKLEKKDISTVLSIVSNVDLLISQPVSVTKNRPLELSSEFLIKSLKKSANFILFPSLYFEGYFPHLKEFKGQKGILNNIHDYIIAYLCSIGINKRDVISIVRDEHLYSKDKSEELVESSLNELRTRENNFDVDINISEFIDNNFRDNKLFSQFNHPKRILYKYVAECILGNIGLKDVSVNEYGVVHMYGISTPIYKSTYKNLGLEFEENFDMYTALNGEVKNQEEIISSFFDLYSKQNLSVIKAHVRKVKPFIPEIISDLIGRS